jgi:flagellar basal-body rod modification protein FlgD
MAAVQSNSSSQRQLCRAQRPGQKQGNRFGDATGEEVQNRFLKLLVTQLQNQDPLNPLDNAAVTTQISQINTVTGIERLNATLETLLNTFNDGQAMQAAALIGKSVLVAGSGLSLANGQAGGGVNLAGPADSVTLKILDAAGKWCRVRISVRAKQAASASSGMARAMPGWSCRLAAMALRSTRYVAVKR